jgi:penicillin-binding protein 1A
MYTKTPEVRFVQPEEGMFRKIIYAIGRGIKRVWRFFTSKWMLTMIGSLLLTATIGVIILLVAYARVLPDISGLAASKESPGMEILAEDGSFITRYGQITGKYIAYKDIPQDLVKAVIATEDRRFFEHYGVDPMGVLRALWINMKTGRYAQGASTITQQLAKNLFLTTDRTMSRKIKELMMAIWLEDTFTKQEIMSIYLNRVYFGGGSYGIDSAAGFYFDKKVGGLTLVESAMLAGLLKAPSRYNPTVNAERTKGRTRQVILNMQDAGFLNQVQADTAIKQLEAVATGKKGKKATSSNAIKFNTAHQDSKHYFSDWIKEEVERTLGDVAEDVIVRTTLNTKYQAFADKAIAAYLTADVQKSRKIDEVAFLSMRPNGAVLAMIGGKDYKHSQYNRVTQALRQPGSAFKMFVYLAAVQKGYQPWDVVVDRELTIGKWTPQNYDKKFRGAITVQDAIAQSINTVAVQLSRAAGMGNVIKLARKLGVKSEMMNAPSLALGSSEMSLQELVTAYAHLANQGLSVRSYGVTEIRRKEDGKILYSRSSEEEYSNVIAIKKDDVNKMNTLLSGVLQRGTAKSAQIGRSAAGKTGTTSNYKDAWFIGYTPSIVAGVWIGNDDATPMVKVTGGGIPARIWQSYMTAAHQGVQELQLPTAIRRAPIYFQDNSVIQDGVYSPQNPANNGAASDAAKPFKPASPSPSPARSGNSDDGYKLDNGFWNKLFDGEPQSNATRPQEKIEYDYPTGSGRRYER